MSKGSKRRPGKGYEDNYERIFKKMNIYLVERADDWGYDEYDSWVVVCKNKEEAVLFTPYGDPYPDVRVIYLGVAAPSLGAGVIHESYNAG